MAHVTAPASPRNHPPTPIDANTSAQTAAPAQQESPRETNAVPPSVYALSSEDFGQTLLGAITAGQSAAATDETKAPQFCMPAEKPLPNEIDPRGLAVLRACIDDGVFVGRYLPDICKHLKTLCAYLQIDDCDIHLLNLNDCMLNDEEMSTLCGALKINRSVDTVVTDTSACGENGIAVVAELLEHNTRIHSLHLNNLNTAANSCARLASVIAASRTIKCLNLIVSGEDSPTRHALYRACGQCQSLRELYLCDEVFTTEASEAIAASLEQNSGINDLCIEISAFARGEHARLMGSIGRHGGLHTVRLQNGFYEEELAVLMQELRSNTALNRLKIVNDYSAPANEGFAEAIAGAMRCNRYLQFLYLGGFAFKATDFALMMESLKSNRALRHLNLAGWTTDDTDEQALPSRACLISEALDHNPVLEDFPLDEAAEITDDEYDDTDEPDDADNSDNVDEQMSAEESDDGSEPNHVDDTDYVEEPEHSEEPIHDVDLNEVLAGARAKLQRNANMKEYTEGTREYLQLMFDERYPAELAMPIAQMLLSFPPPRAADGIATTLAASAAMDWPPKE